MKKINIDPQIKNLYGDIKIGYLVLNNVQVIDTPPRVKKIARKIEALVREEFENKPLLENFNIKKWIQYAERMGIVNDSELPAHIGLLKSILSGKNIPKINCIVDLANIISAKYKCPVGAFDANCINLDITLRPAILDDFYIPLLGTDKVQIPKGEVVYSDDLGVFSRYSKDADRTKITNQTTSIIFVVDGINETSSDQVNQALEDLELLLKDVCYESILESKNLIIA